MRSFSKKLAFVLAAAMVFTSFAPAAKAEAAKEMTINKSSQILYVTDGNGINDAAQVGGGKGNVSEYDFYVKNKPSDWKKTLKFEWSSSNEDVATVNKSGLTTAVAVGKATISCKVTDKDGDVVANSKVKVTVKANAADVEIKNASKISGTVLELKDGKATLDLNRVMYDADGNATTKRGTLVTDYTEWMYEPKTGVEVNQSNGVFTFTAPGEYKLYCRTYQSSKYTKTTAESDPVVVTVVDKSLELKQTSLKKFNIFFGTATDITAADVAVDEVVVGPSGEYRVPALMKDVAVSADKKSATVELFYDMKDSVNYEVSVKGYDKTTLTASAGKPVKVNVWAQDENYKTITAGQVTVGKIANLKYSLIDANGVDVTTGTNEEQGKIAFSLEYNGKSNNNYTMSYYASNASFEFVEVGDYAVVTAEYVNYDYEAAKEEKVTSSAVTFYSVAKQNVAVKSVLAYTTQCDDWFDFGNQNHDVTKLGNVARNNNHLVVKVGLADGKELVVSRQGQTIHDGEDIYLQNGYVTVEVTKSSEDYIGVDAVTDIGLPAAWYGAETQKITLYPRKAGTAQLMVYYNIYLPDGNVQKIPVAPITLKVKEAPTLGSVQFNWTGNTNSANVVLTNKPNDGAEVLSTGKFTIQLKDQYGADYYGATVVEFDGVDNRADELVQEGIFAPGWWNGTAGEFAVNGALASKKLAAMNTTNQNAETLGGRFTFVVKAQDNASKAIKTNTISVDIKGRSANKVVTVATDVTGRSWGGNIARYNSWGDAKSEKTVTFNVFEKMNGANIDYVDIKPYYTIGDINTASEGYYFRVFKDSVDVTKKLLETTADAWGNEFYQGTFEKGAEVATPFMSYKDNTVTLRFSAVKKVVDKDDAADEKFVVAYDLAGAGNYTFQLYHVEKSRLDNKKNVSTLVSTASRSVSTSCDPMKYTLVSRESVVIKNADGYVPANVAELHAEELLYCFKIKDKGGVLYNKYNSKNDNHVVEFNGTMVNYEINLNDERQKPNSVFVDSITFYEVVETAADKDDTNTKDFNEANRQTIYAAYTVPVNCYVEFQQAR